MKLGAAPSTILKVLSASVPEMNAALKAVRKWVATLDNRLTGELKKHIRAAAARQREAARAFEERLEKIEAMPAQVGTPAGRRSPDVTIEALKELTGTG